MSTVHKLTAVVIVIVAAVLAVFTSSQTLVPTTTRVPITSKPLPVVDLSATPAGWVPVAFGDAQVSVPSDFPIVYPGQGFPCKGALASGLGGLLVDAPPGFTFHCLVERHPTMVFLVSVRKPPSVAFVQKKSTMLNGVRVYRLLTAVTYVGYYAASLGVEVIAQGPLARRILATLTRSPRAMALASGSTPAVPPDWKTLTYQGLSLAAPAWWPITRTSYNYGVGDPCNTPGVDFFNEGVGGGEVVLSTDRFLAGFSCPARRNPGPVYPGDGIEVDAGSKTLSELAREGLHLAFSKHCLDLHGLTACPATSPAYSILVLRVTVPGHATPVYVSVGLAGNGTVARTILCSLRRASASTVTPASFLARAKAGIEGTFSAVYKLSAPSSSAESDATVTVAQRAAPGTTAWPGGKPGEWSYRLTYSDGLSVEWLVRGNLLEDCWRVRKSKWRCSAGNYSGDVGIGYTIATIPYLPGMAFMSLSPALEAMPPRASLAVHSEPSSFGRLACVHDDDGTWCLMQDGHLVNWTGLGFVGYSWTKARLVSEQPTAPATDFTLSGVPRGPWLVPPG